ncbi:MAG TPA: exopolysaccharide biosynthesis protein [bacterium]
MARNPRLSDAFAAVSALADQGDPSLGVIVKEMGRRGHAMVILFLTLPFSLPLPVWGLSTPFGIAIGFTALHMMVTNRLWLPARIAQRPVPARTVRAISNAAARLLHRTERYIRPRLAVLHANTITRRFNGFLILLAGAFLALPLPIPGTNLAPAWMILLICAGMLEEDGLLVALGYLAFAVGCGVAYLLIWPLMNFDQVRGWFGI